MDALKTKILEEFRKQASSIKLKIPYKRLSAYGKLKKYAVEKEFSYKDDGVYVTAVVDNIYLELFKDYIR